MSRNRELVVPASEYQMRYGEYARGRMDEVVGDVADVAVQELTQRQTSLSDLEEQLQSDTPEDTAFQQFWNDPALAVRALVQEGKLDVVQQQLDSLASSWSLNGQDKDHLLTILKQPASNDDERQKRARQIQKLLTKYGGGIPDKIRKLFEVGELKAAVTDETKEIKQRQEQIEELKEQGSLRQLMEVLPSEQRKQVATQLREPVREIRLRGEEERKNPSRRSKIVSWLDKRLPFFRKNSTIYRWVFPTQQRRTSAEKLAKLRELAPVAGYDAATLAGAKRAGLPEDNSTYEEWLTEGEVIADDLRVEYANDKQPLDGKFRKVRREDYSTVVDQQFSLRKLIRELIDNGKEAMGEGKNRIGRFGVGFMPLLMLLRTRKDRIEVYSKTKQEEIHGEVSSDGEDYFVRAEKSSDFDQKAKNFVRKFGTDEVIPENTTGTMITAHSRLSKKEQREFFEEIQEAYALTTGATVKVLYRNDMHEINGLTDLKDVVTGKIEHHSDKVIYVDISDEGLTVLDTGTGMGADVFYGKLFVAGEGSKSDIITEEHRVEDTAAARLKVRVEGESTDSFLREHGLYALTAHAPRPRVAVQMGGRTLENLKLEQHLGLPQEAVLELPETLTLNETKTEVTHDEAYWKSLMRLAEELGSADIPNEEKIQQLNLLMAVGRAIADDEPESAAVMEKNFRPLLREQMQAVLKEEGGSILPNTQGWQYVRGENNLHVNPELLSSGERWGRKVQEWRVAGVDSPIQELRLLPFRERREGEYTDVFFIDQQQRVAYFDENVYNALIRDDEGRAMLNLLLNPIDTHYDAPEDLAGKEKETWGRWEERREEVTIESTCPDLMATEEADPAAHPAQPDAIPEPGSTGKVFEKTERRQGDLEQLLEQAKEAMAGNYDHQKYEDKAHAVYKSALSILENIDFSQEGQQRYVSEAVEVLQQLWQEYNGEDISMQCRAQADIYYVLDELAEILKEQDNASSFLLQHQEGGDSETKKETLLKILTLIFSIEEKARVRGTIYLLARHGHNQQDESVDSYNADVMNKWIDILFPKDSSSQPLAGNEGKHPVLSIKEAIDVILGDVSPDSHKEIDMLASRALSTLNPNNTEDQTHLDQILSQIESRAYNQRTVISSLFANPNLDWESPVFQRGWNIWENAYREATITNDLYTECEVIGNLRENLYPNPRFDPREGRDREIFEMLNEIVTILAMGNASWVRELMNNPHFDMDHEVFQCSLDKLYSSLMGLLYDDGGFRLGTNYRLVRDSLLLIISSVGINISDLEKEDFSLLKLFQAYELAGNHTFEYTRGLFGALKDKWGNSSTDFSAIEVSHSIALSTLSHLTANEDTTGETIFKDFSYGGDFFPSLLSLDHIPSLEETQVAVMKNHYEQFRADANTHANPDQNIHHLNERVYLARLTEIFARNYDDEQQNTTIPDELLTSRTFCHLVRSRITSPEDIAIFSKQEMLSRLNALSHQQHADLCTAYDHLAKWADNRGDLLNHLIAISQNTNPELRNFFTSMRGFSGFTTDLGTLSPDTRGWIEVLTKTQSEVLADRDTEFISERKPPQSVSQLIARKRAHSEKVTDRQMKSARDTLTKATSAQNSRADTKVRENLQNMRDAMKDNSAEKGKCIDIDTSQQEGYLVLAMSDNGKGMTKEEIYEKFLQPHVRDEEKANDPNSAGGFGWGAFTNFADAAWVELVSTKNGQTTRMRLVPQRNGSGKIVDILITHEEVIDAAAGTESGTTISVALDNSELPPTLQAQIVRSAVNRYARPLVNDGIKVQFNNHEIEQLEVTPLLAIPWKEKKRGKGMQEGKVTIGITTKAEDGVARVTQNRVMLGEVDDANWDLLSYVPKPLQEIIRQEGWCFQIDLPSSFEPTRDRSALASGQMDLLRKTVSARALQFIVEEYCQGRLSIPQIRQDALYSEDYDPESKFIEDGQALQELFSEGITPENMQDLEGSLFAHTSGDGSDILYHLLMQVPRENGMTMAEVRERLLSDTTTEAAQLVRQLGVSEAVVSRSRELSNTFSIDRSLSDEEALLPENAYPKLIAFFTSLQKKLGISEEDLKILIANPKNARGTIWRDVYENHLTRLGMPIEAKRLDVDFEQIGEDEFRYFSDLGVHEIVHFWEHEMEEGNSIPLRELCTFLGMPDDVGDPIQFLREVAGIAALGSRDIPTHTNDEHNSFFGMCYKTGLKMLAVEKAQQAMAA